MSVASTVMVRVSSEVNSPEADETVMLAEGMPGSREKRLQKFQISTLDMAPFESFDTQWPLPSFLI